MTSGLLDQVSFVVNSINDQQFSQLEDNLREAFAPELPDIVRVPDARSMAEGLNRGARAARGEWLIFCHDDIRIVGDPKAVVAKAMATTDMFGPCGTVRLTSGNWYDAGQPYILGHVIARNRRQPGAFELQVFGTSEHDVVPGGQALDGIWIACRRSLFEALHGFDEATYTGFVGYDIDFSFRAALAGARVGIATGLTLFHNSHVGEFSKEKIDLWERAQRDFEATFSQHLFKEVGHRTHVNVPLAFPEEALEVLRAKRIQGQVASNVGSRKAAPHTLAPVRQLLHIGRRLIRRLSPRSH